MFEKLLQMMRTSSTSILIVASSSWDYGYALLKEAGIYDSAGKPVKQREVRKQKDFCKEIKKIIFNFQARCGWTRPQSWAEVHSEGGAGRQKGEQTEEKRNPQTEQMEHPSS